MKLRLAMTVAILSITTVCFSQSNKSLDQLYRAQTTWNATGFSITPKLLKNKTTFFEQLSQYFKTQDSIHSLVFQLEYTFDKSFSSSIRENMMRSEGIDISNKKRTNYKRKTPIFYSISPNDDSFSLTIGISINGNVEDEHNLCFALSASELKELSRLNLTKAKVYASFAIRPDGEIQVVDSVYFISDKFKKSAYVGFSQRTQTVSKFSAFQKILKGFDNRIDRDQFETSEQYLNRKKNAISIIDSLYSMPFEDQIQLGNFKYDADKQVMQLGINGTRANFCQMSMDVESARLLSEQENISGAATCMINTDDELEIVSPIHFSARGRSFVATPNSLFIPHSVKSIVTLDNAVEMVSNTSDSLIVLNSTNAEKQKLSVYRIGDCSLKNIYEKTKYESWYSKFLEPGNSFVDFVGGNDKSEIKVIFTSLDNPSIGPTERTIDFESSNWVSGLGKKRDNLQYNFLNDDSIVTVNDPINKKRYIFDVVNNSQEIIDYGDPKTRNDRTILRFKTANTPPPQNYPNSGLIFITNSIAGLVENENIKAIDLNIRLSKNEFKYKLLRTIAADSYWDLGEDIIVERNSRQYLHNKISGNEKELLNFGGTIVTSGLSNLGEYILVPKSTSYSVYDTKEDKYLGDIKIPKQAGAFKYGHIKKGIISGTIQIITYAGIK